MFGALKSIILTNFLFSLYKILKISFDLALFKSLLTIYKSWLIKGFEKNLTSGPTPNFSKILYI